MQTGYFLDLKQVIIMVKVSYLSLRLTLFSITHNFNQLFKNYVFFFFINNSNDIIRSIVFNDQILQQVTR